MFRSITKRLLRILLQPMNGTDEWNRLSADCVSASSVNMFKNKIDMYLRRAGHI